MAQAEHIPEREVTTVEEEKIVLTLTTTEATSLKFFMDRIGGGQDTPRRDADAIALALSNVGIEYPEWFKAEGFIHFSGNR